MFMWDTIYSISPSIYWYFWDLLPVYLFEWLPTIFATSWGAVTLATAIGLGKRRVLSLMGATMVLASPLIATYVIAKSLIGATYGWFREDILKIAPASSPYLIDK